MAATDSARCSGSSGSTAPGLPVATLQKAQARVQMSPRIMKVACFCVQHSPIFGQAASSHTVCRFFARISWRTSAAIRRRRRLDPNPVRLARRRIVGPVGLFGMADRRDRSWPSYVGSVGRARSRWLPDPACLHAQMWMSLAVGVQHRFVHHFRQGRMREDRCASARPRWSPASWRSCSPGSVR